MIDISDLDGQPRWGETGKVTKITASEKEKGGSGEFKTARTGAQYVVSWLMLG